MYIKEYQGTLIDTSKKRLVVIVAILKFYLIHWVFEILSKIFIKESNTIEELSVVIPVYNEEAAIGAVLNNWFSELRSLKIDFKLYVYNDGSTDDSLNKIREVAFENSEIQVINKENTGHGPTILQGYLNAEGTWVFQTDSDNEIKPDQFRKIWSQRYGKDLVIGDRFNREATIPRRIVSAISRLTVRYFYGHGVKDVNCPFRLFKRQHFIADLSKISPDTFAPNVLLSGIACLRKKNISEVKVSYSPRSTGEISIKKWKLLHAAVKAWWQTVLYRIFI